jgi:NAD(P)H-dependent FMN reductase
VRTLLIVWWSATGAARALSDAADAAARAAAPDLRVRKLRCDEADARDLLEADGLIFACPEMLGSMAGMMKDFFDRTYYPALDQLAGTPYAVIVSAGSDGHGAIRQIERITTGWRLRRVAPPLRVCTHAQTSAAILADKHLPESALDEARELGATLAQGLVLGVW